MKKPVIQVDGIGKRYQIGRPVLTLKEGFQDWLKRRGKPAHEEILWALRNVSFEIEEGEIVGIIGCNGSGKSTLLKILSRIMDPTEGRAILRGNTASLLEVGTGFHPDLTARENVYMNGTILGMRRWEINRKFRSIVDFAEVEKFIDTPVKHFSSGMYMRLAFAVAAHLEPDILMVDEVLAVGDEGFQRKCMDKIHQIAQSGKTVIIVSHNLATVRSICQRALFFRQGTLAASGTVDPVIQSYLDTVPDQHAVNHEFARTSNFDQDFVITHAGLQGENGEKMARFRTREIIQLQIFFRANRDLKDIRVSLGFNTALGGRISMQHHTDGGKPFFSGGPGEYEVLYKIRNPFMPGRYTLSIGAHQAPERKVIDYVPDAVSFEVLRTTEAEDPDAYNLLYPGIVVLKGEWTLPKSVKREQG